MLNTSANSPTSRRRFIQSCALVGAAFAAPAILSADKSGNAPIVLGVPGHQYEVQHDWGQVPESITYGNTHGVCQDKNGRMYIKHTVGKNSVKNDAVVVFDEKGKFIESWGDEFKGGAHGLHINREGTGEYLYFCDPNRHLVVKTDLKHKEIFRLGFPTESGLYNNEGEYHPTNIATAPNGDFYVADGYGKSWIHQYDSKAKYIRSFGGPGKERGQTSCSHGLMVDTRGKEPTLVVADRSNRRLQYFTLDGRHISFVTAEMRAPCHFHQRGEVLLIPDLESRVTLFDKENHLITHLGDGTHYNGIRDKAREAFTPGKFVAPHGACFDHEGNIFVVEWVEVGRVTKLKKLA